MRTSRVSLSQSARHFAFDQGIVLWNERGSRLYVYNGTVRLLVPSLTQGATLGELADILCDAYGVERQRALSDCAALLDHLQSGGLLEGGRDESASADAAGAVEFSGAVPEAGWFTARINGKNIRIGAGAALAEFLRPLFPDPQPRGGAADIEILCRPDGRAWTVTADGKLRAQIDDPAEIAGAILEQVVRALNPEQKWLAFLHAGSVRRNGAAIVLPGASGSGKSTLIGFLAANGFDYLSDDVVPLVAPQGDVVACPLSISLKSGSRGLYPAPPNFELVTLHDRFRTDQLLLPPSSLWETPPTPSRAAVFPKYQPNRPTSFARIAPMDGLARLFNDRVFLGYPLDEASIANFLRWAERTPFYSLQYGELKEAARCLATLTG